MRTCFREMHAVVRVQPSFPFPALTFCLPPCSLPLAAAEWLRAKEARLAQEERQQAHLKTTIEHE